MIDHLQGSQRQDVVMVLKTRFGGFFFRLQEMASWEAQPDA
jgi:hypothetical protein